MGAIESTAAGRSTAAGLSASKGRSAAGRSLLPQAPVRDANRVAGFMQIDSSVSPENTVSPRASGAEHIIRNAWQEQTRKEGGGQLQCVPCLLGSHSANLKGEDGLRAERLSIGGDSITAALLVDGHGGHHAASLVVEKLFTTVVREARGNSSASNLHAACERSFRALHEEITAASFGSTAGTTVTLALINETRSELTCCNVGDSFGVLITPPASSALGEGSSSKKTGHDGADAQLSAREQRGRARSRPCLWRQGR